MNIPIQEILILAFLTLLEGFFVAAEYAFVTVRRTRLELLLKVLDVDGAVQRVELGVRQVELVGEEERIGLAEIERDVPTG